MSIIHNCAYCNSKNAHETEYTETFTIHQRTFQVSGMKKVVCHDCKSETVPMEFVDYNLELFIEAEAKFL